MSDNKDVPISNLDAVLLAFKSETFVCSVCGEIVFPRVIENDGNISVENNRAELRGGIGNCLLRGNVCEKCAECYGAGGYRCFMKTTMTTQGQIQVLRERHAMRDGITHCPRCGHHVNIQFGATTGYCQICDKEVPVCDKEVPDMEKRTIWVKSSCFAPEFEMIIPIPTDRDDEEYIDELLDGILNPEFRYNVEWDFVDGLS